MHAIFKANEEVTLIQGSVWGQGSSRVLFEAQSYLQDSGRMRAKRGAMEWRWKYGKLVARMVLRDGDRAGCVRGCRAGIYGHCMHYVPLSFLVACLYHRHSVILSTTERGRMWRGAETKTVNQAKAGKGRGQEY